MYHITSIYALRNYNMRFPNDFFFNNSQRLVNEGDMNNLCIEYLTCSFMRNLITVGEIMENRWLGFIIYHITICVDYL